MLCKHGTIPVLVRLVVKARVVENRGWMTRADVLGRITCGQKIKVVTQLLKMNMEWWHTSATLATMSELQRSHFPQWFRPGLRPEPPCVLASWNMVRHVLRMVAA